MFSVGATPAAGLDQVPRHRTEYLRPSGDESDMMPNRRGPLDANSLKHQPSRVLPALALNKHTRRTGTGALHEVREIIIALLREPDETMCVECVATALGQQVGVVMMTMLGLPHRVASFVNGHPNFPTCGH